MTPGSMRRAGGLSICLQQSGFERVLKLVQHKLHKFGEFVNARRQERLPKRTRGINRESFRNCSGILLISETPTGVGELINTTGHQRTQHA